MGKASSEQGLLPNRIWAVKAYTGGKTQLPRSHYPLVCREGSYLVVSCLSPGPPNLVMTEEGRLFPGGRIGKQCRTQYLPAESLLCGLCFQDHVKRNTRAEFAKLKDITFCQPTVNMRLEVLLACSPSTQAAVESQQALAVESPGKEQAVPWKWLQWGSLSSFPLLFALGSSCSSS